MSTMQSVPSSLQTLAECTSTLNIMIEDSFGRVLRELRRNRGLSQDKLADLTDTHRTYISQLERGLRCPSLKTVEAVATALSISIRDLMELVEDEEATASGRLTRKAYGHTECERERRGIVSFGGRWVHVAIPQHHRP